jgi:hypothetical protein
MNIIMKIMSRMLPSCREVSHLTSQAMDESLPFGKRLALRLHLKMCIWCQRNQDQLLLMKKLASQQLKENDRKARLNEDVKSRMANLLKNR